MKLVKCYDTKTKQKPKTVKPIKFIQQSFKQMIKPCDRILFAYKTVGFYMLIWKDDYIINLKSY